MKKQGLDKVTVYVIAILVLALFSGEVSTMVAIASHECQGAGCIELVHGQ